MWRSWLVRRWGLAAAVAALVAILALPFVAWSPEGGVEWANPASYSGDEPHYLMVVNSMLFDRDLDLRDDYERVRTGSTDAGRRFRGAQLDHHTIVLDRGAGRVAPWVAIFDPVRPIGCRPGDPSCGGFARLDRHRFLRLDRTVERSAHPVGFPAVLAALMAPTMPDSGDIEVRAALIIALLGWAGLILVFATMRRMGHTPAVALAATALTAASPYLVYARSYFAEGVIATSLVAALWGMTTRRPLVAGLAISVAVWIKPVFVLLGIVWVAVAWARRRRIESVLLAAAVGIGSIAFLAFNYWQARTPLISGVYGWMGISEAAQLPRTLISREYGLLWFAPWTAIALVAVGLTWWRLARGRPSRLDWTATSIPVFLILFALHAPLGSTCYGPRYWVPLLPFLAIAAVDLASEVRGHRWMGRAVMIALLGTAAISAVLAVTGAIVYRASWDAAPHRALMLLVG